MNPTSGEERPVRYELAAAAYTRLQQIDWTFANARTRGQTHGIHPYPAKFIPQIPQALISALHPGDGTAVMDPFCGSGTTLVEAALADIPAVGVDLHPLACLISKVKVTLLSRSLTDAAEDALQRAPQTNNMPPAIPALDHWFRQDVQRALAALIRSIDAEPDPDVRDALRVAFSSIVVRVSNQESDTRYAAIEKNVSAEGVWEAFRAAARTIERALTATWGGLFPPSPVKIINRNISLVRPEPLKIPISTF
jgi:DNA methylase